MLNKRKEITEIDNLQEVNTQEAEQLYNKVQLEWTELYKKAREFQE